MVNEKVRAYLNEKGLEDRITEHEETIDTVEHAAMRIGCTEAEIAKTLSFLAEEKPVIVVMAGDGRVNSSKFKAQFKAKPHMIPRDEVENLTGFAPGGVCPFGVPEEIPVWLDISMKRFEYVHPAGGNEYTSVKLTPEELERVSGAVGWCDICKGWEESKETKSDPSRGLLKKATKAIFQAVDQNDDGSFDMKDVSIFAGNLGSVAKKAASTVKESAKTNSEHLSEKMSIAKREMELKTLRPIFTEDLDNLDFYLTKLIRIVEMDKKHSESEVCKNSIGHVSEQKGMSIVNIYPEEVERFGLTFYPDKDSELYYVDPSDRDHYIALDDYFNYLKVARVNELQRIAQDLGARHFRVLYKEEKKTFSIKQGNAKTKAKSGKTKDEIDASVQHDVSDKTFSSMEVAAEMECTGHAPIKPELVYFQKDPSIQNLIALRMSDNTVTHQKYMLKCSNTSGIKEKDALKIDAVLASMKFTGNVTVTSEAQSEARRFFEYEIDF